MSEQIKKHTVSDLEQLYSADDEADKETFAEQRSNILLVTGDHYNRLRSNFYRRLRDARSISDEQKIRITKNHIQPITDSYINNIISTAPGVGFEPANPSELQDQKAAEMNKAVWDAAKRKHHLDEEIRGWCEDFVQIGEVATKIFWDPTAGYLVGNDENGAPIYSGDLVIEDIYGFNLLMDHVATSHKKAKHMTIRKMVDTKKLISMFPAEENRKFIQEGADETYTIFDRGKGSFQKAKGQCLLRETYFRPCAQYPNGYVFYWVKGKILFEDELPAGKFPIVFKPFRRMQTKARGQSVIKMLRPYQVEINRASSKIAEHQITLGDDKLLIQNGTKLTAGAALPGVRAVNYTGMKPEILAGRDGSQYLQYAMQQVTEMYNAAQVAEKTEDNPSQVDPYTLLFKSASQKKRFQLHIKAFQGFLIEVCELYLDLARYHLPDDAVIKMVGRKEQVNIAEFRQTDPLCYKINVTDQSDDIESKLGRQLMLNNILQYVGNKLEKEDIGKLIKAMPYSNVDESYNDLTLDYEAATNDILALDRGEQPPVHENDNHDYMIRRLTARMRQADFSYLDPVIQQNYSMRLRAHEEMKAEQIMKIKAMESELIPTGGYLVACDMYVPSDPKDPSKTKRVRVFSAALEWLLKRLEQQGSSMDAMELMNQENLAQIAGMVSGGAQASNQGAEMPIGVGNVRTGT